MNYMCVFCCRNRRLRAARGRQIGQCLSNILLGFGVKLLCVEPSGEIPYLVERGAKFVELEEVWRLCFVCTLMHACSTNSQLSKEVTQISFESGVGLTLEYFADCRRHE